MSEYIGCYDCGTWFLTDKGRIPLHTRSVRGVGWGGKAMHLRCPGSGRVIWAGLLNAKPQP